jgi:class 3 adenylate cyclase
MTESVEPEDVMDVLRMFHDVLGRLVVQYQGTIGYRASDGAKGMIGTEGRFDYTPIGNAVNLSARLSDQAKDDEILINQRALANI